MTPAGPLPAAAAAASPPVTGWEAGGGLTLARAGGSTITMLYGAHPIGEMGCAHCWGDRPQAFRVDVPPGRVITTHFHAVDQFQVILRGHGRMGREPVGPGAVHYVDRNTPYGPLEASEEGVSFLALRRRGNGTTSSMPASRQVLADALAADVRTPGSRRQVTITADELYPAESGSRTLRADDDGLAIVGRTLGAGEAVTPSRTAGGGKVVAVLRGTATVGHGVAPTTDAVAFLPPGADAPTITAGPAGACLLELQYPDDEVTKTP